MAQSADKSEREKEWEIGKGRYRERERGWGDVEREIIGDERTCLVNS